MRKNYAAKRLNKKCPILLDHNSLINGSKLFMDSSIVQAHASNNSVVNNESLKRYLNKSYQILESRLEKEKTADSKKQGSVAKSGIANKKHISTTDPDASVYLPYAERVALLRNAILLIEFLHIALERGAPMREALLQAGAVGSVLAVGILLVFLRRISLVGRGLVGSLPGLVLLRIVPAQCGWD